jgi:sensor histidine kinase YesM
MPFKTFFIHLREWVADRFWRMCVLPSTILSVVLTLFFMMTMALPLQPEIIGKTFAVTTFFAYTIGTVLLILWGIWTTIPLPLTRTQRNALSLLGFVGGVFVGNTLAVILVSDVLGRSYEGLMAQVLVFTLFLAVIAVGLMLLYEQLRTRLESASELLRRKELNEQRLQKLRAQAELSSLQARINPHFLFNSLNSIASLISVDPKRAELAVEMLSRLMRFSLRSSERRAVLLAEEFAIVRTYLDLEKIRLGDRLSYEFSIQGDVSMVCLPGMLITPLVENSIKHGFSSKVCGGRVKISATVEEGTCRVVVEDNGVGWPLEQKDAGKGLANIKERLNLYFNGRCSLELYNKEGAVVDISFPVEGSCSVL